MAKEENMITIKAVAKLEKYDDSCKKEDIEQGKVKPYEVIRSGQEIKNPTVAQIEQLEKMGMYIDKSDKEKVYNKLNEKSIK